MSDLEELERKYRELIELNREQNEMMMDIAIKHKELEKRIAKLEDALGLRE